MSIVRASEKMKFSNFEEPLYVFTNVDEIESYGKLENKEAFCEAMFRVLEQGDVDVDLEMVNKARDRLYLEPLEELPDYGTSESFEDMMERLDEKFSEEEGKND